MSGQMRGSRDLSDIYGEDLADGRATGRRYQAFTSADVKCTWDLLTGRAAEKLRLNPRKSWWNNVAEIAADSPTEATFVLKRPQPAILALIASATRRSIPAMSRRATCASTRSGTGPFKFVEFKPNESIKLARNPDYW